MSKYEEVYFVGDNQGINQVRVDSSKMRNRGAFSGSLAALLKSAYNLLIIKRPARDACLCMGELQAPPAPPAPAAPPAPPAPPAPHFVFLITL